VLVFSWFVSQACSDHHLTISSIHTTLYFDLVFVKKFVLLNLTCRMYHFIKASFYFGSCLSCLKARLVI